MFKRNRKFEGRKIQLNIKQLTSEIVVNIKKEHNYLPDEKRLMNRIFV